MQAIAVMKPQMKLQVKNRNPNENPKCEYEPKPNTIGAEVAMAPRCTKLPRLRMVKE